MWNNLTVVERKIYKEEVREKRCLACNNAHKRVVFGLTVVECKIGKSWPKFGICRGFCDDCRC